MAPRHFAACAWTRASSQAVAPEMPPLRRTRCVALHATDAALHVALRGGMYPVLPGARGAAPPTARPGSTQRTLSTTPDTDFTSAVA
eukprot:365572-Chlamydomonas_euryale.AAC.6